MKKTNKEIQNKLWTNIQLLLKKNCERCGYNYYDYIFQLLCSSQPEMHCIMIQISQLVGLLIIDARLDCQ